MSLQELVRLIYFKDLPDKCHKYCSAFLCTLLSDKKYRSMEKILVLGLGNNRHRQLFRQLEEVVQELGLTAPIEQVMDVETILASGVSSIPAIIVNGKVFFDGKTNPTRAELRRLFMSGLALSG